MTTQQSELPNLLLRVIEDADLQQEAVELDGYSRVSTPSSFLL